MEKQCSASHEMMHSTEDEEDEEAEVAVVEVDAKAEFAIVDVASFSISSTSTSSSTGEEAATPLHSVLIAVFSIKTLLISSTTFWTHRTDPKQVRVAILTPTSLWSTN